MYKLYKKMLSFILALSILSVSMVMVAPQKAKAATIVSQIVQNADGKGYLQVDGKPFFVGHIQNCGKQETLGDQYTNPYPTPLPLSWQENQFEKTAALGYNTISIILYWNQIEPTTPGTYDWTLIDQYIDWCNKYNLCNDKVRI